MSAFGCDFNRSMQHPLETALPGFGPVGFAGAFEELAQQLLPMSERIPRKVGSRGNPYLNRRSGCQLGKVASISIDKCSASLKIYSYSSDSKTFLRDNGFPTKCCVDQLRSPPKAACQIADFDDF